MAAAQDANPDFFTWDWWDRTQHTARSDFGAYCEGTEGWHSMPWINVLAALEWLLLASLFAAMALAHADCELHFSLCDGRAFPAGEGSPSSSWPPGCVDQLCQSAEPLLTRAQGRALLAGVILNPLATCGAAYRSWLQRGCLAFAPAVSDLGLLPGAPGRVFNWGLLLEGLLLCAWVAHTESLRCRILRALQE